MNEQLLQYLWQFQYFNKRSLVTTAGEPLLILHPGQRNTNQGPDFMNASVKIGTVTWAGSVELHVKTSLWNQHGHTADPNYNNVILHVVYEHDDEQYTRPVLELKDRISHSLLQQYQNLMHTQHFIPCGSMTGTVPEIVLHGWLDRLTAERLLRKATIVENGLQDNLIHWEESFWWLLARAFGAKVNADAFEAMARTLPVTLLAKHKNNLVQLEALLLGQCGLLHEKHNDPYAMMLHREYLFLQKKYILKPSPEPVYFLRMRPGNFPTLRLAQLAALVHQSAHMFSKITEATHIESLKALLAVEPNDFWKYHYRLDDESCYRPKPLGDAMKQNIIINAIAPVLFAYGQWHRNQVLKDKVLQWLAASVAEENRITKCFGSLGIDTQSAADSQALIELKTQYCDHKKCLQCAIGNYLLKKGV